jgi:predicted nucleic acid-binding protein
MAEALIFDTTFVIDLQRERRGGEGSGRAQQFLRAHSEATLRLPATALGEFAEGFADPADPVLQTTAEHFDLLPVDAETAYCYGRLTRALRAAGRLIGSNDLWIAAAALRHDGPLVTRNADDFRRVPGLRVLTY